MEMDISVNGGKAVTVTQEQLEKAVKNLKKESKVLDLEVLESKTFEKAEKLVGALTAKSVIEKTDTELKEFISINSAFLLKEKDLMAEEAAVKAAKEMLAEKRRELREATKEQRALLDLAVLAYSKRI